MAIPGILNQSIGRRNSLGAAGANHAGVLSIRQHFADEMTAIL